MSYSNLSKNTGASYKKLLKSGIEQTIGDLADYTIEELLAREIGSFADITYSNKSKNTGASYTNLSKN